MRKFQEVVVMKGEERVGTGIVAYESSMPKRPAHTHLMCPGCGKVWGSVLVQGIVGVRHTVSYVECEEHGGGVFENFAESAPEFDVDVIKHDFLVMCKWLDEGIKGWDEREVFGFGMDVGTGKKSLTLLII